MLFHVKPGEPITAEWANSLVDAVNALLGLTVSAPLELHRSADGKPVISVIPTPTFVVCELLGTLSAGGNASAKILYDENRAGTWAVNASTANITVYAATNMSGAIGDVVLAVYDRQSGLWVAFQKDC